MVENIFLTLVHCVTSMKLLKSFDEPQEDWKNQIWWHSISNLDKLVSTYFIVFHHSITKQIQILTDFIIVCQTSTKLTSWNLSIIGICWVFSPWTPSPHQDLIRSGALGQNTSCAIGSCWKDFLIEILLPECFCQKSRYWLILKLGQWLQIKLYSRKSLDLQLQNIWASTFNFDFIFSIKFHYNAQLAFNLASIQVEAFLILFKAVSRLKFCQIQQNRIFCATYTLVT